jgi:hypothetical protein
MPNRNNTTAFEKTKPILPASQPSAARNSPERLQIDLLPGQMIDPYPGRMIASIT